MQRWELRGSGIEQLTCVDAEMPTPAAHEVLVRVRATSLNYRDVLVAEGRYRNRPGRSGLVPLSDGAGEIVACGSEVTGRVVGDHVAGNFFTAWSAGAWTGAYAESAMGGAVDGMLSQYVTLPATAAVPLPVGYSFEQGAALPCAALTAWNALFTRGALQAGETVLLQGSGGVSVFAMQMARAAGARVVATTTTTAKVGMLRELGADVVIDISADAEWDKAVLAATGNRGADVVVEVGGPGTLERSLRALAHGGRISLVGVLAGTTQSANPFALAMKNATMHGIYVGSAEQFAAMNAFLGAHGIHPVIDRVFPFDATVEAYAWLKSARHVGKVVIEGP